MKVLVVSSKYPPEYAGSGHRAHATYLRLREKFGLEFDVITSSITTNRNERYVLDQVSIQKIASKASPPFKRRKNASSVKRALQGIQYRWHWQHNYWREALPTLHHLHRQHGHYDAIHVFGNVTVTSAAITYAKLTGKPLIVELVNLVDNPQQYEPWIFSQITGNHCPENTLIVCLSEKLQQVCLDYGYAANQIWCRPNPIDKNRFHFSPRASRPTLSTFSQFSVSDIIILHLAKFIPRKHQLFMVEVLARLPSHFKLVLAGPLVHSGPLKDRDQAYMTRTRNAIKMHQLEDRVLIIPEFVQAPETFMKAADVFVLPSEGEAFGTPFLEAIACGTPTVVNDIPGVFDPWVKPGTNGYICKLDAAEWAEKIQMAHHISETSMRQSSREVLAKASTETIDQAYHQHLQNLIAQPSSHE